ncbi:MAG TPA: CHRD domain-containing protein [Methylomirabilota bacterium]|nr:CHRD domain-containing protein [Methylomirabilota bacterium]
MRISALLLTVSMVAGTAPAALAEDGDRGRVFDAQLSGYHEVHFVAGPPAALRGAVSTVAEGTFRAVLDAPAALIRYELSYAGLEGAVTQAHIHFGQARTVGGIVVWLCQTAGTPAPAAVAPLTPICPASGTVTGTITPLQVLDVAGQGIVAQELDELVRAIRAGATYANVHSATFGPGEIRGQIHGGNGPGD